MVWITENDLYETNMDKDSIGVSLTHVAYVCFGITSYRFKSFICLLL